MTVPGFHPDPDTVVVHIPIAFARRGGRKTLITPDGSSGATPPLRPQANSVLITALARAFRWRKQLETGVHATILEIAKAERVNDSYVSRILRLTLLAPDIVEEIIDGRHGADLAVRTLTKPLPVEWSVQRCALKI